MHCKQYRRHEDMEIAMNIENLMKNMSDDTKQLNSELLGTIKRTKQRGIKIDAPAASEPVLVFETYWRVLHGPELISEYRFDETRKWRLDYYEPVTRTAIEIHGGVWSGGRHTTGRGFTGDREKMNAAQAAGITVFELAAPIEFAEVEKIHKYISRQREKGMRDEGEN